MNECGVVLKCFEWSVQLKKKKCYAAHPSTYPNHSPTNFTQTKQSHFWNVCVFLQFCGNNKIISSKMSITSVTLVSNTSKMDEQQLKTELGLGEQQTKWRADRPPTAQ